MRHTKEYLDAAAIFSIELSIQKIQEAKSNIFDNKRIDITEDVEILFDEVLCQLDDKLFEKETAYKAEFNKNWWEVIQPEL